MSVNQIMSQTNELTVPASCPTPWAPTLLSAIRRCQGFRVRAACENGAARLSYSIASHGGGSTTRVDFLSPFFLELRDYSGWTRLLHQVNIPWRTAAGVFFRRFPIRTKSPCYNEWFSLSLNSEEAKSTTWLHPVSGEAVITGHRKTPGKVSVNGWQVSLLCLTSPHVRRHVPSFARISKTGNSNTRRERERGAVTSMLSFLNARVGFCHSRALSCPASTTSSRAPASSSGRSVSEVDEWTLFS